MNAATRRLLSQLAATARPDDLAQFHADLSAMSLEAFLDACRESRPTPARKRPAGGARDTLAYAAADRARRKLLIKADVLIDLLAERLEGSAHVSFADLSASDRKSLTRFVAAASERAGDAAVIAAAEALVREKSLASDIL